MTELFWYILAFLTSAVVVVDIILVNNVCKTMEAVEALAAKFNGEAVQE